MKYVQLEEEKKEGITQRWSTVKSLGQLSQSTFEVKCHTYKSHTLKQFPRYSTARLSRENNTNFLFPFKEAFSGKIIGPKI